MPVLETNIISNTECLISSKLIEMPQKTRIRRVTD